MIEEEIMLYVSSKETNGALLLTGKWGSGKTYLIRETAKRINKGQDNAVIIISLFGLENTDELNRKVKEALFQIRLNKDINVSTKERFTQIKNFTSILSEYSKIARGVNSILSVNLYDFVRIENRIEYYCDGKLMEKNLILVFDDFERSKIDTTNLMGAINDYVENKAIKTILIADEEKINKDEYKDFKEKLIFRTIRLKPNYSAIISKIISNYCETFDGYSDFLQENYKIINQIFYESNLENIRSLKAMIIDFERVYTKWVKINIGIENIETVLYTFGATLLEHRSGKYNKSEYGYLLGDSKLKEKYTRFAENNSQLLSLQNWITTGEWDDKNFENEIISKYADKHIPEYKKFLLYNFWELDSKIISTGLDMAISKAYEGELTCDELISLLQKIHYMNEYKINIMQKPNYKEMQKGLDKRERLVKEGKLTKLKRNTFIMEETLSKMEENAITLYRKIENFSERLIAWENRLEFIKYLEDRNIPRYDLKGKCIVSFDTELLETFMRQYKLSENYSKREISLSLYNLSFTDKRFSSENDILESKKNFIKLRLELENIIKEEVDGIAKAITYEQIKLIDKIVSSIEV